MREAVIVSTARTPIGKAFRGAFNNTHGATMGGHAIEHAVSRARVDPGAVEDVIMGCDGQEHRAPLRSASWPSGERGRHDGEPLL